MPSPLRHLFLPNRPNTPPRSPHFPPQGFLSYFSSANPSARETASFRRGSLESNSPGRDRPGPTSRYSPALRNKMGVQFLRPSRRELVLVLLTAGVSFILFAGSQQPKDGASNATWASSVYGSSLGKLADPSKYPSSWSSWLGSESSAPTSCNGGEANFWDSAAQYGTASQPDPKYGLNGPDDDVLVSQEERLLGTHKVGHAPGWTMMERAYVYNGSVYVVTEDRLAWPELDRMTSTGKEANGDPGNAEARYPTGEEIKFISASAAAKLWDDRVQRISGLTWLFNDGQFVDHYYHFAAELLMGAWRCTASADEDIGPKGETTVVPPRRAWFLHQDQMQWRDKPRFNPHILYTLFPSISMLYPADWEDMRNITAANPARPRAFMFEKILYADRSASFYGPYTGPTSRTVASALYVGKTSRWWWEPIRRQVLRAAGLSDDVLDRNLEGLGAIDPMHFAHGDMAMPKHAQPIGFPPGQVAPIVPKKGEYQDVVTYISRQGSRRHLTQESHDDLIRELEKKRQELGFELVIVQAEKLSIEEQLALAGRTTIMLGVHGNGLTHLIWMPATPRSAVIELYIRGGFARDYQWTAHALGMRHYGVNHDVVYTVPFLPPVEYPDGFHGTEITVDGKTVADIVAKQLTGLSDEIPIEQIKW